MGTIGELGLAVHSESAVQAAENLDRLVESGVRAEQAVNHLGETSEQAKARVLGLAKAALESSSYQETLNRAYEATAGASAAAAREQLNHSAAIRQSSKSVTESASAQEKLAASERKTTAATTDQTRELEKLLAQIDPTTAAYARLDKQQQQLAKFKAIMPANDFADYSAKIEQTRAGLSRLDEGMSKTGASAKQTSAALRTVPAQVTDIFTSIAGGQSIVMVALQQGGQLKDSFGGIGSAAKAVGGYVLGLVNPFTVAAAAAAALGYVYYDVEKQVSAFNKALFSGTASSGQTSSSLAAISKDAAAIGGSISEANDAVIALAGSGKLSQVQFKNLAEAAASIGEYSGKGAGEVAKSLSDIGDSATDAAQKISAQYGLLTYAQYEVIAALDEQGRKQEALDALSEALNQNAQERLAKYRASLSDLERDWNDVGTAISNAYSRIKGGLFPGIDEQIARTQKDLDEANKGNVGLFQNKKEMVEFYTDRLNFLQDEKAAKEDIARYDAENDRKDQERIAAQRDWKSEVKKYQSDAKNLEDEVTEAKRKGLAAGASQVEIEKTIASIRERSAKKNGTKSSAVDLTSFNDADNKLKALTASFQNSMRVLDASQKAGLITQQQYAEQKSALIQKEKTDVEAAYQGEISALESVRDKSSTTSAQRIQIDQKISDSKSKMVDALKKLDADQEVLSIEMRGRLDKDEAAIKAFAQTVQDSLNLAQQGLDNQLAGFGLSDKDRGRLQEDLKIRQDYQKQLEKLTRDYGNIVSPSSADKDKYDRETQILKGALDQRLAKQEDYYRKEDALRGDWSNGVSRSWRNYVDEANDAAGLTESAFTNAFTGIEDVFVDFVTNGKASFKDFADSVLADLARIVFKQQIMAPLLQSMFGSTPSGDGIGQASGQMFGGGTGSGFTDILSMGQKAVGLYQSGAGQAFISGFQSGTGIVGGIESGLSAGYASLSGAITGNTAAIGSLQSGYTGSAMSNWVAGQAGSGASAAGGAAAAGSAASTGVMGSGLSAMGAAGYGIGGALYGYQQSGVKGAVAGGLGAAAGAVAGQILIPVPVLGAAIGAFIGGTIGGSLFGGDWQTKDQGLSLGVESGDFAGQQYKYQKKKGGLFGKNKSRDRFSALSPEMQTALGNTYDATEGSVLSLFERINVQLNDGVLDGLNIAASKISTKDKTAEQIQEEIAKWFGGVADSMVSAVDAATGAGLGGFNFESLTTFVNNLYSVNDVLKNLNVGLFDLNVNGGYMAQSLSAMAGGLEALTTSASTYYDNFFTDTEKADDTLEAVRKQFEAINMTLPASRQGYRDIIEALDVTTEAGRAMFVTLTGMAGNAASAYSILEQRSDAAAAAVQAMSEKLIGVAGGAQSALQRAISAQQKATTEAYNARVTSLNDMVSTATENVSGLTSVGNDLGDALKALRGDSDDAVKMLRAQAQATLQSALATARSGGSLSGFTGLSDALDTVSSNNTDLYGSMEDFARDQGRTANVVAELNGINGKQLTTAEKSLKGLEDQIKQAKDSYDLQMAQYDQQLDFAQAQMDALNGIDSSIKSVVDAISAMNMAVISALAGMGGKGTTNSAATNGAYIDTIYTELLGRDADKAGKDYWLGQVSKGDITLGQLAQAIANAAKENKEKVKAGYATGGLISGPGSGTSDSIIARLSNGEYVMRADAVRMFGTGLLDQMNAGQIPAFATGGGVGELGPQLEVTVPSRIYSANQSSTGRGNDRGATAAEVQGLRRDIESNATYTTRLLKAVADGIDTLVNSGVQIIGTVDTKAVPA
ncbi:phage tail tape measure protein, lambda family [Pseudomonas mohnii]|uniref:Phage tail tape measure protein, lambda family n=1 Tax=Pseudomonas mohnii TaxID=395600 RepID=A0ABY0YCH9_9PSED|nr:phage tail tape measure protein [Pseudomonas mohnii]SED33286.1 phage tail tape measure protein, lambda family [Pseudomonas mohnii]